MMRALQQCTKRQAIFNYFFLCLRVKDHQIFVHPLQKGAEHSSVLSTPRGSDSRTRHPKNRTAEEPGRHPRRKRAWHLGSRQRPVKAELPLKHISISENLGVAKNIALEFFQHLGVTGTKL